MSNPSHLAHALIVLPNSAVYLQHSRTPDPHPPPSLPLSTAGFRPAPTSDTTTASPRSPTCSRTTSQPSTIWSRKPGGCRARGTLPNDWRATARTKSRGQPICDSGSQDSKRADGWWSGSRPGDIRNSARGRWPNCDVSRGVREVGRDTFAIHWGQTPGFRSLNLTAIHSVFYPWVSRQRGGWSGRIGFWVSLFFPGVPSAAIPRLALRPGQVLFSCVNHIDGVDHGSNLDHFLC